MKKLLVALLIIVSFYGCEKNYVDVSPSIIGKWSWVSTCGGFAFQCIYADSTPQKIKLIITADSIYKFYQNDTLIVNFKFHTYELTGYRPDNSVQTYLMKWDSIGEAMLFLNHDQLTIGDGSLDGYSWQYKRIK
jgi:hypothetical protein